MAGIWVNKLALGETLPYSAYFALFSGTPYLLEQAKPRCYFTQLILA
jgi:hypothetical protein